jgi:hypothetical protein
MPSALLVRILPSRVFRGSYRKWHYAAELRLKLGAQRLRAHRVATSAIDPAHHDYRLESRAA